MPVTTYTVFDGEIVGENRNGSLSDYVPDPLGSTRALLDNSQTQTDTLTYWPYGEVQSRTGSTATPFQFIGTLGYSRDWTQRTFVRARHYQQVYGRWMTVDPLWPREDPYAYVGNSPITFADPSGNQRRGTMEHPCSVRTKDYCAAARRHSGKNKALNCFCYVSDFMCKQIEYDPIIGAAFLDCLNRCIWKEFDKRGKPQERSDAWTRAMKVCNRLGYDSPACCLAMVWAEQDAFTKCLDICHALPEAGRPPRWWRFCVPGDLRGAPLKFPFAGTEAERIQSAWDLCCEGAYGSSAWINLR